MGTVKKLTLAEIPIHDPASNLLFEDELISHTNDNKWDGVSIRFSTFRRVALKGMKFSDGQMKNCLFEDVYARKAVFNNMDFSGSTFRNCNFTQASFHYCDFRYCTFYNCIISSEDLMNCLPKEHNLCKALTANLKDNFITINEKKKSIQFLNKSIVEEEKELWQKFVANLPHYKKYSVLERLGALLSWISLKLSGLVWGHGHKPVNLFFLIL
jgi:hypothetical protein